eukprot:TRINITY_DN17820_c0_g1_i2.p1 TRINITY_DN17820_c0_g1~~TRINITY_DN17820_c0_g1_i2.p1  ORF type:complete len:233 (-),score=46.63 TRINITY_DN17820_c0_g1_i2:46-744(-)
MLPTTKLEITPTSSRLKEASFSPYENNGGTTLAVCGDKFAVVAADTRMSNGYSISTRDRPKLIKLTDKAVLASSGMTADILALHKLLKIRLTQYEHKEEKQMPTVAIAQLLSNTLYYRRFFPFYTFNVLAGIDEAGEGWCFSYDAVGSFEKVKYASSGTGQTLMQPLLDNQVGKKNQTLADPTPLSEGKAVDLVKDAFASATERDIYTGDYVDVCLINAAGVQVRRFDLRKD